MSYKISPKCIRLAKINRTEKNITAILKCIQRSMNDTRLMVVRFSKNNINYSTPEKIEFSTSFWHYGQRIRTIFLSERMALNCSIKYVIAVLLHEYQHYAQNMIYKNNHEKEFLCDRLTIQFGYGKALAKYLSGLNHPASFTHPSCSERIKKLRYL